MTTNTTTASLLSFLSSWSTVAAAPICRVWSVTSPEMLEKKRGTKKADGQFCPYKCVTRQAAGSFQLAREEGSYGRRANATLVRQGDEPTFVAEGLWVDKNGVPQGKAGEVPFTAEHIVSGEVYLMACTPKGGQPIKSVDIWTVDGCVLEGAELETFKENWLKSKPSSSAKQADAGIEDPNKQAVVRTYHIENIVMIESGSIGWSETDGAWGLQADVA